MKKIITLLAISVLFTGFYSCIDDTDNNIAQPIDALRITTPNTEVILEASNTTNPAITIVWDHSDYGINTQVNYVIEMGLSTTAFETPKIVGQTSDNFYFWSIEELNNEVVKLGLTPDIQGDVEIRVKSTIGSQKTDEMVSNTMILTVTPYNTGVKALKNLFLVGDATSAGWDNNNNNTPIVRDPANKNIFKYTGKFGGAGTQFKFLEVLGQSTPQYGDNSGALAYRSTDGDPDPSPLSISAEGYYTIEVNVEDLTYTINTYDASGATDYTTQGVGIIGDSTTGGWDTDTDLTQSSFDPHLWYINGIVLIDGDAKFRTNNDWAINWGSNTALTGYGTAGGDNIPVTSGTYNLWFNDLDNSYIFIPQN